MEPKIAPFGAIFIKLSNSQAQQTNQQTCREQQSEANLLRENFVSDHVRMILSKAVAVTVYTSCVSTEEPTTQLVQTFHTLFLSSVRITMASNTIKNMRKW